MKIPIIYGAITWCCLASLAQAQSLSVYAEPPEGWVYTFEGNAAAPEGAAALDGTWSHDNGSDVWDGSAIGEGRPGGVSALDDGGEGFIRMQDPGDPRTDAEPDPGDRKVSFLRDMRGSDGGVNIANGGTFDPDYKPLRDGVTLNFRARLPTSAAGGPIDELDSAGTKSPFPAQGDGGTLHDGGKGMFAIHEANTDDVEADQSGKISFSLGLTTDEQEGAPEMNGLIMNSKAGPVPSADVEAGQGVQQNLVPIEDLTQWHEFWITIIRDDSDADATHKVSVYVDGSVEASEYFVTAGTGEDNASDYIWLSLGATPQSAVVDIDFYRVSQGINEPTQPSDPNLAVSSASKLGQVATVPATHQGTIAIRNTGESKALNLSSFALSGADAGHWKIDSSPGAIPAGGAGEVAYTFNSLGQTGGFLATLSFNADDPDTATKSIALSASVINTAGPAGHYTLDSATVTLGDEPQIADITGYERHGSFNAGGGSVIFGQASLVGGNGQAVKVADGGTLQIAAKAFGDLSNYTASAWVNLDALPAALGSLFAKSESPDNPNVSLLVAADGSLVWLVPEAGDVPLIATDPVLSTGERAFVALVASSNADKVEIYVNGALAGSGEGLGAVAADPGIFYFGSFGPLFTSGIYDDIQIHAKALSAEDVKFLFDNPGAVLTAAEPDSDGDGLTDSAEAAAGTDPVKKDTDGDSLTDGAEVNEHGTNPLVADSDGDGRDDGIEIAAGTDPNDALSPTPPTGGGAAVELTLVETGLGADAAAQLEKGSFGEDALTFSDRTHQHNSAAFDSVSGALSPTGDLIVPLPSYLVGQSYVKFANDARDQAGYSATVTANAPANWYLLLDNRIDGPAGNASHPNSDDPVLGGTFQWVIDGGWQRVNTGISPNGQADYTGVDESGDGGLNQFYSVWTLPEPTDSVTVSNNGVGGSNMISLVARASGGGSIPGLLGYWRFDGGVSDSSGNGHDGTLTNGAALSDDVPPGATGQSLQVSGGQQHFLVPHSDGLNVTEGITIAAWVKPVGDMAWDGVIAKNPSADSADNHAGNYELRIENGTRALHLLYQNGGVNDTVFHQAAAAIVSGGTWSHVAVTAEKGGSVKYFINGELVDTHADPVRDSFGATNTNPLYIGSRADLFTAMDGFIDDVALFDRALSVDEIIEVLEWNVSPSPARFSFESVTLNADGIITVTIPDGETWDVEYSTDLVTWQGIAADLSGTVSETNAGRIAAPAGFYRGIRK